MENKKVSRDELRVQEQRNAIQYAAMKKQMKAEIEDNKLRIEWLESRKKLAELNKEYNDEKTTEIAKIKWIIDEICDNFTFQTERNKWYEHFNIPVPQVVEPKAE